MESFAEHVHPVLKLSISVIIEPAGMESDVGKRNTSISRIVNSSGKILLKLGDICWWSIVGSPLLHGVCKEDLIYFIKAPFRYGWGESNS